MFVLLGSVFIASLLGSLHCVGMCGPFALIASASASDRVKALKPTVAYSLGRLFSYTWVGGLFGLAGMALNHGTSLTLWQQTATLVAGCLMIGVGSIALLQAIGVPLKVPKVLLPIQSLLTRGMKRTQQMPPMTRAWTIGVLTSLMPCGWLYTFAITAAGTGSPTWGAALMAAFWAGTVPVLVAVMLGYSRIGVALQRHVPTVMATLVIAVGIFTISSRASVDVMQTDVRLVDGKDALIQQVEMIDQTALPCCHCEERP